MRRNPLPFLLGLSVLLHGLVAWRLLPPLALSPASFGAAFTLFVLSGLLVPAPLLIRLSHLPPRAGDALAWAGYLAMGLFSGLFLLGLLREILLLPLWAWSALQPGRLDLPALRHGSALAVVLLALLLSLLGFINARRLARVVEVQLPIAGLPAALHGFSIVQLSDIHVGPTIKRGYLQAIVRRVNALAPDLVAITGDVVDGSVAQLREHVAPLASLRARHGVYAVTGNHEYYHGGAAWVREWQRLGLNVLMNESTVIERDGARLLLGGVADFTAHHFEPAHASDPARAARHDGRADVKILLAHQPRSADAAAAAGFDVQLSGHTHGGQFLPWNLFVPLQQPIVAGLARVGRMWVYVSRGTGYWGPPLRLGAPSEITRLRLVPA